MLDVLKKSVTLMDCLIIGAGFFWLVQMDFANLGDSEKVYIVIFGIWILMLAIRIYIVYKNSGGKK